jgi:hypothetical protein
VKTIVRRALHGAALFCFLFGLPGCRDDSPSTPVTAPVPLSLTFVRGDSSGYNQWDLDPYGYPLSSTKSRVTWTVDATGLALPGQFNAVRILQTTITFEDVLLGPDTLMFATNQEGDVYWYGFLAEIAARRGVTPSARGWDRIAAVTQGFEQQWLIGYLDSAAREPVYGEFTRRQDLFSVRVNGEDEVFPGFRVNLSGPTFDGAIWLADHPPCVPQILEESDYRAAGRYREMVDFHSGSGGAGTSR